MIFLKIQQYQVGELTDARRVAAGNLVGKQLKTINSG
jgi:hypothetical protein